MFTIHFNEFGIHPDEISARHIAQAIEANASIVHFDAYGSTVNISDSGAVTVVLNYPPNAGKIYTGQLWQKRYAAVIYGPYGYTEVFCRPNLQAALAELEVFKRAEQWADAQPKPPEVLPIPADEYAEAQKAYIPYEYRPYVKFYRNSGFETWASYKHIAHIAEVWKPFTKKI